MIVSVYAALVLSVVFCPLPVTREAIEYGRWRAEQGLGSPHNFRPFEIFRATWGSSSFVRQVGGNVALLFPLGLILGALVPRWSARVRITFVVAIVFAIETAQAVMSAAYGFRFRSFDVDDLWLNVLGGFAGLAAAGVLLGLWPKCVEWLQTNHLLLIDEMNRTGGRAPSDCDDRLLENERSA